MDNNHQLESEVDEDWEEWDGKSPFWIHCVAGSFAGLVEHTAVYPLDTVRTHIQVCASCIHNNAKAALLYSSSSTASQYGRMAATSSSSSSMYRSMINSKSMTTSQPVKLPMGMWQTIRFLVNEPAAAASKGGSLSLVPDAAASTAKNAAAVGNYFRLFHGVQTVLLGCIPAHAVYFSTYESVKYFSTHSARAGVHESNADQQFISSSFYSGLAGALAVCGHDVIMTPMDTLKQRYQLGYFAEAGVIQACRLTIQREGVKALFRSLPITLASNIPYGMIMVTTNEFLKQQLFLLQQSKDGEHPKKLSTTTILISSSMAGLVASALTTPLDRIKTALQTQELVPACIAKAATEPAPKHCRLVQQPGGAAARAAAAAALNSGRLAVRHATWWNAAQSIYSTEGWIGFARGMIPRILSHTPAVAISWITYETTKQYLSQHYHNN